MESKKILFFGTGFFQKKLLQLISKTRNCIIVDSNKEILDSYKRDISNLDIIRGDLSSIPTWRKIDISIVSHILLSVQDFDIIYEISRIAREVLKIDIPIIIIWYKSDKRIVELDHFNVRVINPLDTNLDMIFGLIEKNYLKPTNIGLGKGEIVEVTIMRRSHLLNRKLRYIKPFRWNIVLGYRNNEIIIPDKDFELKIGDRVIIVGEPKVVENIVNILTRGVYEFPLQFGEIYAVLLDDLNKSNLDEILWFNSKVKSRKITGYCLLENTDRYYNEFRDTDIDADSVKQIIKLESYKSIVYIKNIGIISTAVPDTFTIFNFKIRYLFQHSKVPILLSRGRFPYEEIIVLLNGNEPDRLIELGSELTFLLGIKAKYIYVSPPEVLRSKRDEEDIKARSNLISDFENINRVNLSFEILNGNPVREMLKVIDMAEQKILLLVVATNSKNSITFFSTNVSYLLASRSKLSIMVLPDELIDE